jgi:cytochrome c553
VLEGGTSTPARSTAVPAEALESRTIENREMMNRTLLSLAVALVFSGTVVAGDPEAGQAKTQACVACHAEDGNSLQAENPKLAGQNFRYLFEQLQAIRDGDRPIPVMTGQLDGMDDQDLRDIAAFYAAQQGTTGQADPELAELGEAIYRGGIRERGVPACMGCHSPTGQGNAPAGYPKLAGQHAEYTEKQLRDYRAAADGLEGRTTDSEERQEMRTISFRLSDREIRAVSTYIEGLH